MDPTTDNDHHSDEWGKLAVEASSGEEPDLKLAHVYATMSVAEAVKELRFAWQNSQGKQA